MRLSEPRLARLAPRQPAVAATSKFLRRQLHGAAMASSEEGNSWAASDDPDKIEVPPLPVLVRLLQDQDSSVMTVALKGLGALGADAR